MQAFSISMVMLGVSDLDVSIAFYRDKLGYSVANRSQEFGFLSAGTVSLILSRPLGAAIQPIARAVEPILSVPAVVTVYRELRRKRHKDCLRKIRILPRARQQVISGRLAFPAAVGHARPDRARRPGGDRKISERKCRDQLLFLISDIIKAQTLIRSCTRAVRK